MPVAAAAWIVAAVLIGDPSASWTAASIGGSVALLLLAVAIALRHARAAWTAMATIALVVGATAIVATSVALRADIRAPPDLATQVGPVVVSLVATEEAVAGADRIRGTASRIGEVHASVPVLVVATQVEEPIGLGTQLRLRGSVSLAEPGESIAALVVADETAIEVLAPPPGWLAWGNALRAEFRDLAAALPGDGASLVTGLAIGDDRDVPQALEDAMRASSLTHLTAVSGANCAIVVGAVMVGGAILRIRRPTRIALALVILAGFVVLVTPQPSVVRAAVMAAFALGGLAAARPMRGLPLLSLAVAGILIADPWASREFGFVLSVLATAGLLVLSGPLTRLLAVALPHPIAAAIAVPAAAQLACQPAIALLDPSVPTYGIVANLLAVPAAPLATVAGLLACLLAPLAPPLAAGLAWVAWLPASWIGGVATTFAGLPAARLPWLDGLAGVLLYAFVTVAVGFAALAAGRTRLVAVLTVAAVAVGYGAVVLSWRAAGALSRPADWQMAMCDVGQGDAAVIRSAGAVAVIDAGPEPAPLAACLAELGVARIDLLVLSHFDHDHVGGTSALVGRVARVLTGPVDAEAIERVLDPLAAAGAEIVPVGRGDAGTLGSLVWRVLWPSDGPGPDPGNAASVVVRFDPGEGPCPLGGCLTSMFLGDLGEPEQLGLLALGPVGRVDVVKVSHHGSADQAERLYGALAASIGLIGVGAGNDYGHPTDALLATLRRTETLVGRTDDDGLLLVGRDDAGRMVLWRERGG